METWNTSIGVVPTFNLQSLLTYAYDLQAVIFLHAIREETCRVLSTLLQWISFTHTIIPLADVTN